MPLRALDVKGIARVLKPENVELSPLFGVALSSAPALLNNLYALGSTPRRDPKSSPSPLQASSELARELYFKRDERDTLGPCKSPSKPSFHLTPRAIGRIVGLAKRRASETEITESLREEGYETNKYRGHWTGVSFARYKRIVNLLQSSLSSTDEASLAFGLPLVTRLAWEKSDRKADLWGYYEGLVQELGTSVMSNTSTPHDVFNATFDLNDLSAANSANIQAAHERIIHGTCSDDSFTSSAELVVASLSLTHAVKPAWKIQKHGYKDNPSSKKVPDCMEVCVREAMDMLLFDQVTGTFDLSALPSTSKPELRQFYERFESLDEADRSTAWFDMVQGIERCDYISRSGVNVYELLPSIKNLYYGLAYLLGMQLAEPVTSQSFGAQLNAAMRWGNDSRRIRFEEKREMFRAALSEEQRRKEICIMSFDSSYRLELTMESAHRLATAKHERSTSSLVSGDILKAHHSKVMEGTSLHTGPVRWIWPALLEDELLFGIKEKPGLAMYAAVIAGWGPDRERWQLKDQVHFAERTDAEKRIFTRRTKQLVTLALEGLFASLESDDSGMSKALIMRILTKHSTEVSLVDLALAIERLSQNASRSLLDEYRMEPNFSSSIANVLEHGRAALSFRERLSVLLR